MIENLILAFYSYLNLYFLDVFLFLLVGYVFIRCRSIGYAYSGVLILFLIFFSYVGGYAMPQVHIAITILLGTLAGGWRYLAQARSHSWGFGFPFFSLRIPQLSFFGSWFERLDTYQAERRYRKIYTEERAREQAKKDARGSYSQGRSSKPGESKPRRPGRPQGRSSDRFQKNREQPRPSAKPNTDQKTRQQQRKESFKRARPEPPPQSKPRNSLEILGLSAGYSQDELKERYRKLASQYHPDKYQNMSDTVKQEMNAEFVAVKQAYEKLKK